MSIHSVNRWIVFPFMALLPFSMKQAGAQYVPENEKYLSIDSSVSIVLTGIASKRMERISDAPGVVTVITRQEMQRFGGLTLGDIIQRAPSLQFLGSHLFPQNTMVMRGDLQSHYDNHILILINGRPFRDDISGGQNATLYEAFPINTVDRIEFIRGPGSVLYGTNAFDGVVNIVTRKPAEDLAVEITAGGGSFGGKLGHATVGGKKGKFDVVTNANFFNNDGWDFNATTVYPSAPRDTTGSMKYFRHLISGSLFLNGCGFSLNAYCASMKRGNLGLNPAWQMGGDGNSWLRDERAFLDAGYLKHIFEKFTLSSNITLNYCNFESHGLSTWSTENSSNAIGEISFGGAPVEQLNFIVGCAAIERWSRELSGAKIPSGDAFYYYGYAQVDYTPIDMLKFFTGAQFNKAPKIKGVVVPRIGAIFHPTEFLGVKINYARAFRSAMPLETNTYFPGVMVGNPLLKPEFVNTLDFQVFLQFQKIQSSLTLFRSSYSNLIVRIPHPTINNTSSFGNTGSMLIQGVEGDGKLSLISNFYLEVSATYQNEVNDKTLSPNYLAKGGLSYESPFGLNVGVFNNYYGRPKPNTAGKSVNPEANAVHLLSINIDYRLPFYNPIRINVLVQNALDQDYNYPEFSKKWVNTLPLEPGRAIYGTVSLNF